MSAARPISPHRQELASPRQLLAVGLLSLLFAVVAVMTGALGPAVRILA